MAGACSTCIWQPREEATHRRRDHRNRQRGQRAREGAQRGRALGDGHLEDRAKARALADEVGGRAADSTAEATAAAEVVILAVYRDAFDEVLAEARDTFDGKILVDVSNRANENPGLVVDGGSNAEQLQDRLPNARVVKGR
ncbi:MAG: NAD(P)-binding domain-containing protein [Actinobacteria bacterium]|nr:NAD(P)-binding domain-containing protein [Actinomycetota bacterium]